MNRWTRASYILSVLFSLSLISVHVYAAGPTINAVTPNSSAIGETITIIGSGFGASQGTSIVTFNGIQTTTISRWNSASVTVVVPTGATTGNVVVTVNGDVSNGVPFTIVPAPAASNALPLKGSPRMNEPARKIVLGEQK